jgi:prepilin-type N-terminal cleavage/methylation domain-containing protein
MSPTPHRAGFTLVELMVAMGVVAILGLASWRFYSSEARTLAVHSATLEATDKIRATMSFVSRELRLTGYDPTLAALTATGYKGIRYAGPNGLWVEFDRNGDGSVDGNAADPNAESVIYSYDATNQQILRTVAGVSQTLVKNVPAGSFTFLFYDSSGSTLAPATTPTLTVPPGYPSVPSSVSQALTSQTSQALSSVQRDLVVLVRVGVQVQTTGITPATNLSMAARITVPNRILDRL